MESFAHSWEGLLRDRDGTERRRLRVMLEREGFAVIHEVLSAGDVDRITEIVREHMKAGGARYGLGKSQPNAAVAMPELAFLFGHEKIIRIFKWILGEEDVVFTGHCDVHMNMLSGWHKDSGETVGGYFRGNYFGALDCRVYKIGIYLQEVVPETALRIRRGSHRDSSLLAGEEVALETKRGDAVLFDVRLTHSGQLPDRVEKLVKAVNLLLNRGDRLREDSRLAGAVKQVYWKLMGKEDRMSVFFTFGAPNSYTRDFAFFNVVRQNRQSRVRVVELPLELSQRFVESGVVAYDPTSHELWPRTESL